MSPYFFINLHAKDFILLSDIQQFFKVGAISSNSRDSILYQVNSVYDLVNVIIPHFEQFPLITQKYADFLLFKSVVELIQKKEHLNIEGLHKIVGIKASINKGLSKELVTHFSNRIPVERPVVVLPKTIDPY